MGKLAWIDDLLPSPEPFQIILELRGHKSNPCQAVVFIIAREGVSKLIAGTELA